MDLTNVRFAVWKRACLFSKIILSSFIFDCRILFVISFWTLCVFETYVKFFRYLPVLKYFLTVHLATEKFDFLKEPPNKRLCGGCGCPINDRFLLKALDRYWHEDCLKCGCCECRLGEVGSTLYTKANLILCRRDYLRWVLANVLFTVRCLL